MKIKLIVCFVLGTLSNAIWAQSSFNMVRNGIDSSALCNGTLYDHGGPTGNYFNNASDLFYITPPGGTLSISFTAFNTENCCDRVWIYDGRGTNNLIGNYRGSALPNGGNPIIIPSGIATIRFTSDFSVTRSGFALTWTAGSSGTPTAQFNTSTTNPAVLTPVQFTNTSLNGGQSTWDFGDGNSSTNSDPSHSYSAPGTYQVRLIENSCTTADTSAAQTITVQNFPTYTYSPSSIADTVNCNGIFRDTVSITKTAGGTLNFNATGQFLGQADLLTANFNTGIAPFTVSPTAGSNFSASAVLGNAASGSGFLRLSGNSFVNNGLEAPLPQGSVPTNLSFYTRVNSGQFPSGEVRLVNKVGNTYFTMFEIEIQSTSIRVRHRFGSSFQIAPQAVWNLVEIENIDYLNETFDFKVNGVTVATNLSFFNGFPSNGVNLIDFNNFSSASPIDFDEVRVYDGQPLSNISFSPSSSSVTTNTTVNVPFTVNVNGLFAGLKNYELKFSTNGSGNDSTFTIPLNLFVEGTPAFVSPAACFDFDTTFVGLTYTDSTYIFNTGCDTLRLTSVTSSNTAFTPTISQLNIAPLDSAFLSLTFSPTILGSFTDTLFLQGSNIDTSICLNAAVFLRPEIGLDSANYSITSLGCNDSVPFNFYLKNNGGAPLNWNIPASGQASFFDDFENGFNSSIWASHGSNQIVQNGCYSNSGTAALHMYGLNREAITTPVFLNPSDTISFWARDGQSSGFGCENPDGNEVLLVEYRLVGNTLWTNLTTVPSFLSAPTYYSFTLPSSGLYEVRFVQFSYSSSTIDNYVIDDFSIGSANNLSSVSPNSGSLVSQDSIQVSGFFNVSGLSSGTYNRQILINSNDPQYPDTTVNVNLTVNGAPSINILPSTCKIVDTVFTGGIMNDSILVYNSGCDSLQLSSFSFSNSFFTIDTLSATIAPEDSLWLPLIFSPSGNQLGLLQDTLVITNNDTIARLCVEGVALGAPVGALNPDSLSFNVTDCGGLITDTVYLSNTGLSPLNFLIAGGASAGSSSTIEVLLYTASASFSELNNVTTLLNGQSDFNVSTSNAFNSTQFSTDIQGKDVIVFPENSQSTFTLQSFAPDLQTFVNDGGVVIMLASFSSRIDALGLMNVAGGSAGFPFTVNVPNHPVVQGLPATILNLSATRAVFFNDLTDVTQLVAANGNSALVAAKTHDKGASVYIGYDYFATDINIETMLFNSVRWSRSLGFPDNITIAPDSGQVATADSTALIVTINTAGLNNGTYNYSIEISTNDPINPIIDLPINLVINGSEKIELVDTACVSFNNVLQGAVVTDTVRVTNIGCDTLTINSFTANLTEYSILNLPQVIAPGDTNALLVQFAPLTVGTFTDTLILNNSDTAIGICVSGTSAGAAFIQIPEDTIYYELNKCKIVGSKNFKIKNQGQGVLNFNLEIGRYTSPVSTKTYNTSGASTTHSFTGLPTTADSIIVQIVLNGDYEWWNESADVYAESNNYIGNVGNGANFYQPDTFYLYITGANANTYLSDGNLDIRLDNNFRVDGGAGSFHAVSLRIVQSVNWVSVVGANAGTIPAGDSLSRNLLFNAALLPVGRHITTLNATSNSPSTPTLTRPIVFDVISEPKLLLSDTCTYFGLTPIGDTVTNTVMVYNDGCQPLNVSSVLSTSPQFRVSPANGNVPVGDSLALSISFIPTSVGTFNASILLFSNDTNRVICILGQADGAPVADFNFNDENICIGEVSFVNNSQFFSSLLWDFGDGTTSNQANVIHAFATPGTYRVRLRVSNALGSDTISKLVTVNPLAVDFGIAANDTIQLQDSAYFSDSSSAALSWLWNFGDGNFSTLQNPSHKYNAQGRYDVTLRVTDQRNCTRSVTKPIWVENRIGLEELTLVSSLKVYPNPSKGIFNLKAHAAFNWQGVQLEIRDAQGRIVHRAQAENAPIQLIDISHLATGLYHLGVTQVKAGKTITVNRKLVLE